MLLSDHLTVDRVAVPLREHSKDALLSELVALAAPDASTAVLAELLDREASFPTSLADGVALPHVRSAHVTSVVMAAGVAATPIAYDSAGTAGVDVFFLVISPAIASTAHLMAVRAIVRCIKHPSVIDALRHAHDNSEFVAIIRSREAS